MSIKIIEDGPEIVLTRTQHEILRREWEESQRFMASPRSFESWLRSRRTSLDSGKYQELVKK